MPPKSKTALEIELLIGQLPAPTDKGLFETQPAHASPYNFADRKTAKLAEEALRRIFTAKRGEGYDVMDQCTDLLQVAQRSPPLFLPVIQAFDAVAGNLVDRSGTGTMMSNAFGLLTARKIGNHLRNVAMLYPGMEPVATPATPEADLLTPEQAFEARQPLPSIAGIRTDAAQKILDLAEKSGRRNGTLAVELKWIADAIRIAPEGSEQRASGLAILRGPRTDEYSLNDLADKLPLSGPDADADLTRWRTEFIEAKEEKARPHQTLMRRVLHPTLLERALDMVKICLGIEPEWLKQRGESKTVGEGHKPPAPNKKPPAPSK